jgi:hypothetical protein
MLASALVSTVKLRCMLPTSSSAPGTADADVMAHANDELQSRCVPLLMSMNEEFLTSTTDVPLVGGQAVYRVPDRCAGSKLRDVTLLAGNVVIHLPRIEPEMLNQFVTNATGTPVAFVMEAGGVRLVPTPSAIGLSLRMRYFVRPGAMVTAAGFAALTSATVSGLTATLGQTLGPTATDGHLYDVVSARPPFEFLAMDGACTDAVAVNPSHITFASVSPGIQAGDYLCQSDTSPLVQLPTEMHSLLAQLTVCRMLQQLGQYDKLDRASAEVARLEKVALNCLTPRVDGAPRKMRGLLQNVRRAGWFGY